MSIKVQGKSGKTYTFNGPYSKTSYLEDKSGVYLIVCSEGKKLKLLDVGESATVKTRVENHNRKKCWEKNCKHNIKYAVLYTPYKQQVGRKSIEQDIRDHRKFPCGER